MYLADGCILIMLSSLYPLLVQKYNFEETYCEVSYHVCNITYIGCSFFDSLFVTHVKFILTTFNYWSMCKLCISVLHS